MEWKEVVAGMTSGVISKATEFVGTDAWDLVSDEGKKDVIECAALLVECQLLKAAGQDVSNAEQAVRQAIANWGLSGKIRVAQHRDEFLDELKAGLLVGLKAVMTIAIGAVL